MDREHHALHSPPKAEVTGSNPVGCTNHFNSLEPQTGPIFGLVSVRPHNNAGDSVSRGSPNTNAAALAGARGADKKVAHHSDLAADHARSGRILSSAFVWDRGAGSIERLAAVRGDRA